MYVTKLVLENIKGFRHLEFDFDRGGGRYAGWTVFTGGNGSGKSTLLKAIAIALVGRDTARALQPSYHRWVSDGNARGSIQLTIMPNGQDDAVAGSGRRPEATFIAGLDLVQQTQDTDLEISRQPGQRKNDQSPERTIWSTETKGWFSCGYGPFRRMFGASPEAMRQMVTPRTDRFVTMFQEAASLAEVDQWMRSLQHKQLEGKRKEGDQLGGLMELLRGGLLPNEVKVDRVDSDGLWLTDRNGVALAWTDMSDGYRSALALVADIVRHLFIAFWPDVRLTYEDGLVVFGRSGVILIDEVDAHLHPSWQREIGFWLKSHFPNIQFLVTTHSPLICQAADARGLFVLPNPGSDDEPFQLSDDEYRKVIVSRPDTILLSSAFGLSNTRSPRVVEARAEKAKLNAKKRARGYLDADDELRSQQLDLFISNEDP